MMITKEATGELMLNEDGSLITILDLYLSSGGGTIYIPYVSSNVLITQVRGFTNNYTTVQQYTGLLAEF